MDRYIKEIIVKKSRKERNCDSCAFINNDCGFEDFLQNVDVEPHELETINKMKRQEFKIPKGTSYVNDIFIFEGDLISWKSDIEMKKIFDRYFIDRN